MEEATHAAPITVQEVPLELIPIHGKNVGLLRRQFLERDVWRNFGYRSPPTEFMLRVMWRQKQSNGVLFHRPDLNENIGFALWFGEQGPHEAVEFAIALTNPGIRGQRLGRRVGLASEDYIFGNKLCDTLTGWGDASNSAMFGLCKSCGWEVLGPEDGGRPMVDGHADTMAVEQTYERWAALRLAERGYVPTGYEPTRRG